MGLFSSKKVVVVDSVVYNLAGPLEDRPSYLKTSLAKVVFDPNPKRYIGEGVTQAQLSGPTMTQRALYRWGQKNFGGGRLTGNITQQRNLEVAVVAPHIPVPAGHTLSMYSAFLDMGEVGHWAERYILETRPEDFASNWIANYTPRTGQMSIQYEDASYETITLTDFDPEATYVVAHYALIRDESATAWAVVDSQTDASTSPDTAGWVLQSQVGETETWVRETLLGYVAEDGDYKALEEKLVITPHQVSNGVSGQITVYDWTLRERRVSRNGIDRNRSIFLYKIGSGNTDLDELNTSAATFTEYFPIVPLRLDNLPVDHADFTASFETWAKTYKKATGAEIGEMLADIEDNPNVDDIDFAFLVHGVEVNTDDPAGQRYVYEFLRKLIPYQISTVADAPIWQNNIADYNAQKTAYQEWIDSQTHGGTRTPPPPIPTLIRPSLTTLDQKAPAGNIPYQTALTWAAIGETIHTGLGRTGAKKGDFWWEVLAPIYIPEPPITLGGTDNPYEIQRGSNMDRVRFCWQDSETSYRALEIYGMLHRNLVYKGKAVEIALKTAVESAEETGFIMPLHYPTLRELPLTLANQLALIDRCVVFNCYQVVKIRWYQRGIFKIAFVLVVAVISAVFFPGAAGLLGANIAVGTSLGFAGMTAVIVGAVANTIAAMLLTSLIQAGAKGLFGDEIGALIGSILSLVAFSYITSFTVPGSQMLNWGDMMRADNILKMVDAVTGSVTQWVQARTQNIYGEMQDSLQDYQERSSEISDKSLEMFGTGIAVIDPLMFLGTADTSALGVAIPGLTESPTTFLGRTLLTGSDISDMSLQMIDDFVDMQISLPDPIT